MPLSVYLLILIELIFVSYLDFKEKKIKNFWSILNIFLFIIYLFVFPNFYFFNINILFVSFIFLIGGFFLFVLKIMGGGDAKFLASFFLLIPENLQEKELEFIIYWTILVGGSVFIVNCIKNFDKIKSAILQKDVMSIKKIFGSKFSFAPVILFSWIHFGWALRGKIYI